MLEGHHYQNAYITTDLEKSVAQFRTRANIRHEFQHEGKTEVTTSTGPNFLHSKLALLWVEDLQYEFIQPLGGGLSHIYRDAQPADGSLGFHHIATRVADWDNLHRRLSLQSFPIVFEGASGPLKFLYVDARPLLGHYLEYTSMPDEVWAGTGGR